MKTIDVYALGNALVDSEFKVTPEFLNEASIEKGLMTLIDEKRLKEISEKLNREADKRACGGSAANTVIALAQLGGSSFYAYKVNDDEDGKFYTTDLKANGVDFSKKSIAKGADPTGRCVVFVTPDADRTMNSYLGISASFASENCDFDQIKDANYLYIEGYLVTSEKAMKAVDEAMSIAKSSGAKIALTLSDPGIVKFFKDQFKHILKEPVDLLFCNEEEAMSLTDTENISDAFEGLKNYSKTFAITTGKSGSLVFNGEEKIEVEGFEVEAVDSNGAGDMYAGAFMFALSQDKSFSDAGRLASFFSSRVVSSYGPRVEKGQMRLYMNEFKGMK